MRTVLLPPGGNPSAVKYIISYHSRTAKMEFYTLWRFRLVISMCFVPWKYTYFRKHPARLSCSLGTCHSFPGVRRPVRKADHSSPPIVQNGWSLTFPPLYAFVLRIGTIFVFRGKTLLSGFEIMHGNSEKYVTSCAERNVPLWRPHEMFVQLSVWWQKTDKLWTLACEMRCCDRSWVVHIRRNTHCVGSADR